MKLRFRTTSAFCCVLKKTPHPGWEFIAKIPRPSIKNQTSPQTLWLHVFCRLMENKRAHLGREHRNSEAEGEDLGKLLLCAGEGLFISAVIFFMSSLTKNGIDHSHHDVHWGRYVGAECNIFI